MKHWIRFTKLSASIQAQIFSMIMLLSGNVGVGIIAAVIAALLLDSFLKEVKFVGDEDDESVDTKVKCGLKEAPVVDQGSVIYRAKSLNGLKKHGVLAFSVWWCYNSMHGASGSPDLRR